MTLDEYKNKIISNVMKEMEDNCKYRWSDVFDYICENLIWTMNGKPYLKWLQVHINSRILMNYSNQAKM